ncbi:MAG: serine/threonine-protein kinase [Myxococcota bacterium]
MSGEAGHDGATLPNLSEDGRRIDRAKLLAAVESALFDKKEEPIRLGRYTLVEKIGRGGFGIVYRAHDPALDRPVAIKLLRSRKREHGFGGADALIREARMAAQLQHPNVVRIFDVGQVEGDNTAYGGDVFIVMELLHGEPLHTWLKGTPRTHEQIVEMFLQVADGLAAAHQRRIVHCDVKPANVFVTADGQVKVLDFGLALHSSQRMSTLSRTGERDATGEPKRVVAGTPMYMAPEAHDGSELDAAADQYSFGMALIESLAGAYPFAYATKDELPAVKLDGVPGRWLKHREIPRGLVDVLTRATSPHAIHRYPGMDSLATELRRWLNPSGLRRVLLAAGLVLVGSGAAFAATREPPPCEPRVTGAVDTWENARPDVDARWARSKMAYAEQGRIRFGTEIDAFVESWTTAATTLCSPETRADPGVDAGRVCLRERLGRLEAVLSMVDDADDRILLRAPRLVAQLVPPSHCLDPERQNELPPTPEDPRKRLQVAEIRDLLSKARAHHAAGTFDAGMRLAKEGLARATETGFEPTRAEAMYEVGLLAVSLGDLQEGADYLEQAYLNAEGRKHDRLAAASSVRLVSVHGRHLMNEQLAREWARRAEYAFERLSDNTRHRASLAYNLGLLEHASGDLDVARDRFEHALELYESVREDRDASICRMALGVIENEQGHPERAIGFFQDAYAETRATLGLEHPDTATTLSSLAGVQSGMGQLQVARENLLTALEIVEHSLGDEHHVVASTLINVGVVEFELANYIEALAHQERALEIYEASLPEGHPRIAIAVENIAAVHTRIGNYEKARAGHARALAMRQAQLGPKNPLIANAHANLGLALAHLGRHDEAEEQFDGALDVLRAVDAQADRASVLLRRAQARILAGARPLDDLRASVAAFELGRPKPQLAEARFELAKLLVDRDRAEAVELARSALGVFLSMDAGTRARPIEAWLSAHPLPE